MLLSRWVHDSDSCGFSLIPTAGTQRDFLHADMKGDGILPIQQMVPKTCSSTQPPTSLVGFSEVFSEILRAVDW